MHWVSWDMFAKINSQTKMQFTQSRFSLLGISHVKLVKSFKIRDYGHVAKSEIKICVIHRAFI